MLLLAYVSALLAWDCTATEVLVPVMTAQNKCHGMWQQVALRITLFMGL